ncbi:hypothetical protein NMG60_11018065 [Bertholletia excelsa]
MEAFSLLKFWRVAAGDDSYGSSPEAADDEDSFFDLEFPVPSCNKKGENDAIDTSVRASDSDDDLYYDLPTKDGEVGSSFAQSTNDVVFREVLGLETGSKPQSPISFPRSPAKLRVFMLFKKPRMEKTETTVNVSATPKQNTPNSQVEEVPVYSLLARVNSSRSRFRKQNSKHVSAKLIPKDLVCKYLKLIKPIYIRASKRFSDKVKISDDIATTSSPLSSLATSPAKLAEEKQGNRQVPALRVVYRPCRQLGKSRSASSAVGIMPPAPARRDDSLLQQHDGIQSAILHCKRSYNSSSEFSALEVQKRCSI